MPPNALQTEVANLREEIAKLKATNAALLATLVDVDAHIARMCGCVYCSEKRVELKRVIDQAKAEQ